MDSWFKREMTLGNVMTTGTVLLGLGASWAMLRASTEEQSRDLKRLETRIERVEMRTERDREDIATVKSDVRIIRHIVESARAAPLPAAPFLAPR